MLPPDLTKPRSDLEGPDTGTDGTLEAGTGLEAVVLGTVDVIGWDAEGAAKLPAVTFAVVVVEVVIVVEEEDVVDEEIVEVEVEEVVVVELEEAVLAVEVS